MQRIHSSILYACVLQSAEVVTHECFCFVEILYLHQYFNITASPNAIQNLKIVIEKFWLIHLPYFNETWSESTKMFPTQYWFMLWLIAGRLRVITLAMSLRLHCITEVLQLLLYHNEYISIYGVNVSCPKTLVLPCVSKY